MQCTSAISSLKGLPAVSSAAGLDPTKKPIAAKGDIDN
jgi:hypothetical protein